MEGMQPASQIGTATCSKLPKFNLEDFQAHGPNYRETHGLHVEDADVVVVGFYYAD